MGVLPDWEVVFHGFLGKVSFLLDDMHEKVVAFQLLALPIECLLEQVPTSSSSLVNVGADIVHVVHVVAADGDEVVVVDGVVGFSLVVEVVLVVEETWL